MDPVAADGTIVSGERPAVDTGLGALTHKLRALLAGAGRSGGGSGDPLAELIREHRALHPTADTAALRRAYDIAESAHQGQLRKSGEPFITHPLAVARILAALGMDTTALVAALLQVVHDGQVVEGAWSAGDCAAVPDLASPEPGALCSPSAQHAVRQAVRLADNIRAELRGRSLRDYRHKHVGSVASLGLHHGVAQVYGIKIRGLPAWFMHRTYHLMRIPSLNRKIRVVIDWTLALFLKREVVSLGQLHEPRESFTDVTPRA